MIPGMLGWFGCATLLLDETNIDFYNRSFYYRGVSQHAILKGDTYIILYI